MSKLRVFEAFAGIGTQSMALKRLGVDYKVVGIAEIDKFAIQSYMAIHGETKNYGDISKIDPTELPDMDLFTYSFPCQDLSISGKQRGMSEGTRSGLLYECEKVITTKRPKHLLLENVKNLVGKKFKPDFDKWLEWLESQGYRNYWQVLNAKDYGVPQNRERVFVVSILGEGVYNFPESFPLEVKLKDTLEDEVDEKYFLNQEYTPQPYSHDSDLQMTGKLSIKGLDCIKRVYSPEGVSPALTTMQGGHRHPKIINYVDGEIRVKEATKLGYKVAEEGDSINLEHPDSKTRRGRVGKQVAQTLTTSPQQATIIDYRIRRLTPLECWRLMGITDEDFYKAKAVGMSDSQLYKQAGNAIVVDVLVGIFGNLFNQEYDHSNIKESAFEFSQIEFPFVYNNELEQLGRL
ncbi:DNA cytosine methyltransferase [Bacillus toyonensis]|uniref:DNA cytosine methyltransferase n=1 Tax=Bacillus toyonensis TaxID=155322 RepID=UPI000BF18F6D|nr:DNA cytosine methyltransferase [Bacillus toyonensis]PEM64450.1 DNA (cytosine-5-)-methyltransferase [Bacillus toyonensis]